jgi:signal transduction histidine kinase
VLRRRWARSLFSRVFFHGLFVLLASFVTVVALAAFLLRPEIERRMLEGGSWIAQALCSHLITGEGRGSRSSNVAATAYSAHGALIGSLVTPPIPPLSTGEVAQLRVQKTLSVPGAVRHAFWCDGSPDAYVEVVPPRPDLVGPLALPLISAVLVVALASIPLARSIARPLAELVRVSQAFGRGELAIRTEIARGDEVGELARAFNQMADRLQRLILAEQELLANVSHELRTPLARVRVVLETAQENPPRAQALLQEISSDLGDLERLLNTVMEAMRLEMRGSARSAGLSLVCLEPTDLAAVAQEAAKRFTALHPERQIELAVQGDALEVEADPRLLRHLLDNILDNAHKYSDHTSPIALRVMVNGPGAEVVRVDVVDQGLGIDSGDLPHLFEPFFRGQHGRTHSAGGAGLGLALAKRIVDAHGGSIEVSSTLGIGTTVRVGFARRQAQS